MAIEFRMHSTLSGGTHIAVMKHGRRIGAIYHAPDGLYRLELGDTKMGDEGALAHNNLDRLKAEIRARLERSR